MLIYSLIFQIRRTYVVFRFKSIIYTVLLAVITVIVSFIIIEILIIEKISIDTKIII